MIVLRHFHELLLALGGLLSVCIELWPLFRPTPGLYPAGHAHQADAGGQVQNVLADLGCEQFGGNTLGLVSCRFYPSSSSTPTHSVGGRKDYGPGSGVDCEF